MPPLPFILLRSAPTISIVLAGLISDDDGHDHLRGFDPVRLELVEFNPSHIDAVVSIDPAAVYFGVQAEWDQETAFNEDILGVERAVANRARYLAKGGKFPPLPPDMLSGFPIAEPYLRRHRMKPPTIDAIRVSGLFAVSTVRTRIEQAETQFDCFGQLYRAQGRQMPDLVKLRDCFVGLQNSKTAVFAAVAAYAATIHEALKSGLRDRALRRHLALEAPPPDGLGLAKLSFTLALLGQDTICLDARLLGRMFPRASDRMHFEKQISKREGRITEKALATYEAAEDAFLEGNRFYNPKDPIGRARAQWMSWEGVGQKGATHRVWLNLLPTR
jgi:hypothetical protein